MPSMGENQSGPAGKNVEDPVLFFCKLFDDRIGRELCFLRRTHFSERAVFTCRGCSMVTTANSPHSRARKSSSGG